MIRKVRKKKNPSEKLAKIANQILKNVDDYEYLAEGVEGDVFYFIVSKLTRFDVKLPSEEYILEKLNIKLNPGEYVLKVYRLLLDYKLIEYYEKLAYFNLIPKLYYITSNIQISKYVFSKNLEQLLGEKKFNEDENRKKIIYKNILKEINRWNSLNFGHGDLAPRNILVDKNNNVYFIDPEAFELVTSKSDKLNLGLIKSYLSYNMKSNLY